MTEVRPDELRVSDDERRAVDALLHRAVGEGRLTLGEYEDRAGAVWAARTRGELAAVTRDLPGALPAPVAVPGEVRRAVAVLGEERLQGPFGEGQRLEGWAVLGSSRLDLARPDLPDRVDVRAVAVMGEVEVVVPAGAHVQLVGGASLMGERSVRVRQGDGSGPLVRVTAVAVMGAVRVRSSEVRTGRTDVARPVGLVPAQVPGPLRAEPVPASGAVPLRRRRRRHRRLVGTVLGAALLLTVGGGAVDAVTGEGRLVVMSGAQIPVSAQESHLDVTAAMGGAQVVVDGGAGEPVEVDARTMWGGVDVLVMPAAGGSTVERTVEIDARALMGGVSITVPEGTRVRLTGGMIMGGASCEGCLPVEDGTASGLVVVDARGAMGGVSVETATAREIRERLTDGRVGDDPDDDDLD